MKKIENLLLKAAGYTVLIICLFYLFAATGDFTEAAITFPTFAVILIFGLLISFTELVFLIDRLKTVLKFLIHYSVLLIAFTVIFIITGNLSSGGAGVVFSALIIFTFLYALIFTLVYFIRKFIRYADRKVDTRLAKKKQPIAKKSEYKSLYGKNGD